jgi:hypothetical protein
MAEHRRERDDLSARLTAEKEMADDAQHRAAETQQELGANAVFLERAGTDLSTYTAERETAAAELRKSLSAAEILTRQLEQASSDTGQRCQRLEDELLSLRQQREELTTQMMVEQRNAAESKKRGQDLERRLLENSTELARFKTELQKPNRGGRSEMEQAGLQQVREALNAKLTSEQWQANEAMRRSAELEAAMKVNAAELEKVKAERDKLTYDQTRVETDLQAQLESSTIAAASTGCVAPGKIRQVRPIGVGADQLAADAPRVGRPPAHRRTNRHGLPESQ